MLYIYLCEDNAKQRAFIEDIIHKIILFEDFELSFACSTDNPHTILEQMNTIAGSGIYFLDIDLHSDMNGLLLAQKIRQKDPRGFIIFITTHSEMSYMTFTYKVEALDFIIKDKPNELHTRIHQCILDAYYKYKSPQNSIHKNFTCFSGEKEYCILLDDILFFETSLNAHKLLLHEFDKIIEFTGKLSEIEKELPDVFYRLHRSFLINKKHIKEIDMKNRLVTMSNGEVCIASLNSLKGLKQK